MASRGMAAMELGPSAWHIASPGMGETELAPSVWREFLGIGHAAIPSPPGKATELDSTREDARVTADTELRQITEIAATSQLKQDFRSSPAYKAGLIEGISPAAFAQALHKSALEEASSPGLGNDELRTTTLRGTGSSPAQAGTRWGQAGSRWGQAVEAVAAPTDALSKHSSFPPESARRPEASRIMPAGCLPATAAAAQSPLQRLGGRWDLRATQIGHEEELVKVSWGSEAVLSQGQPCSLHSAGCTAVQALHPSHVPRAESVESAMLSQGTVDELSSLSSPGTVEGLLSSRRGIFEGSPFDPPSLKGKGGPSTPSANPLKATRGSKKGIFGEGAATHRGHSRGSSDASSDAATLQGAQGTPVRWGALQSPFRTKGSPRSRESGACESPTVGAAGVRKVGGLKPRVPSSKTVVEGSPRESRMRRSLLKVSSLKGVRASGSPGIFWEGILMQPKAAGAEAGREDDGAAEDSGPESSTEIISGDLETLDMESPGWRANPSAPEHQGKGRGSLRRLGGRWDVREVGSSGEHALVRVSANKLLPHGSCLEEDECEAASLAFSHHPPITSLAVSHQPPVTSLGGTGGGMRGSLASLASEAREGYCDAGRRQSVAPSSECLQDDGASFSRGTSMVGDCDVKARKRTGQGSDPAPFLRPSGTEGFRASVTEVLHNRAQEGHASWMIMEEGSAQASCTDFRERGAEGERGASERAGDEAEDWQWHSLEGAFNDMLAQYRKGQGNADRSNGSYRSPVQQLPVGAETGSLPHSGLKEAPDSRPSPSSGGSMADTSSSEASAWDIPVK